MLGIPKLAFFCWVMSGWSEILLCVGMLDGQISCMVCFVMMGVLFYKFIYIANIFFQASS